jgi:hypothetical protein
MTNRRLFFRRLKAPMLRVLHPWVTACHHCGTPWYHSAEPRSVEYKPGSSIFFACQRCWPLLTDVEKIAYAHEVVYGHGTGWRWNQPWDRESAALVMLAVTDDNLAAKS